MGETFTNAVLDAFPLKKVFYVIRRGYNNRYLSSAIGWPYRATLQEAQRFDTVRDALCRIPTIGGVEMSTEIVRVEEITTEGTKRRIEVPLGDKRQTGVAFRNGPEYANPGRWHGGGLMWGSRDSATVFSSIGKALQETQRFNKLASAILPASLSSVNTTLVGIAEETNPGTTKYTETVLA